MDPQKPDIYGIIGAPLVARFSQFYPDRVTGIILCVEPARSSCLIDVAILASLFLIFSSPPVFFRHRRGGASYSPPSPQPLNVDAILAAIAPILGYENIGYFKFFAADHAPKELDDHVCTGALFVAACLWTDH